MEARVGQTSPLLKDVKGLPALLTALGPIRTEPEATALCRRAGGVLISGQ